MGRNKTGIREVNECKRIELGDLIKSGFLAKGMIRKGTQTWTDKWDKETGQISIISNWTDLENPFLRLVYIDIHGRDKTERKFDYKIELTSVPSNLGKGNVWYFLCPSGLGIRCRKLYYAYRSGKWYSRAYFLMRGLRIYYPSQSRSKNDYEFNRKHLFDKKYKEIYGKKHFHAYHKGKKTKAYKNFERISAELDYWTEKTNKQFIKTFGKYFD